MSDIEFKGKLLHNEDAAKYPKAYHYGERWIAYAHEPKGEHHA